MADICHQGHLPCSWGAIGTEPVLVPPSPHWHGASVRTFPPKVFGGKLGTSSSALGFLGVSSLPLRTPRLLETAGL